MMIRRSSFLRPLFCAFSQKHMVALRSLRRCVSAGAVVTASRKGKTEPHPLTSLLSSFPGRSYYQARSRNDTDGRRHSKRDHEYLAKRADKQREKCRFRYRAFQIRVAGNPSEISRDLGSVPSAFLMCEAMIFRKRGDVCCIRVFRKVLK